MRSGFPDSKRARARLWVLHQVCGRFPVAPPRTHSSTEGGFALVVTLMLLVLMLGLTLAFFSRVESHRKVGHNSKSGVQAGLLADAAENMVLKDFLSEIAKGSEELPEIGSNGRRIFRPVITNASEITSDPKTSPIPISSSMTPHRAGAEGLPSQILKVSQPGESFFTDGPARASTVSTKTASAGRSVSPESWLKSKLLSETDEAEFLADQARLPRWIYVNRQGETPVELSEAELRLAADPVSDEYVIGRYAYIVYDVGGLLDVNVVGNGLSAASNLRKGRLHQVKMANAISGVDSADEERFVEDWRWKASAGDESALFDATRDFRSVLPGDQAIVNRQDLLDFIQRANGPLPSTAGPMLTTFSRSVNAPHWEPSPWRPKMPPAAGEPNPDELNPAGLGIRFTAETELERGADAAVTVPAGTPVMTRRFPLRKLSLLEEAAPDPDSLRYYFGVEKVGPGMWRYVEDAGGRIKRLSEVAMEGREPNFFEILQAALHTDSLGKTGGSTVSDDTQDSLRNLQILRVGANIIDQWDGDDIPTIIEFPSGNAGEFVEAYGTENLPYVNQVSILPFRPSYDRDLFQFWALFDVWNPHQNASSLPQGISGFRIIPVSGEAFAFFYYALMYSHGGGYFHTNPWRHVIPQQSVAELNPDPLTFAANQIYVEPVTIGGNAEPTETFRPGLLLVEEDVRAAGIDPIIPPKPQRTTVIQRGLNDAMDLVKPYVASPNPYAGVAFASMPAERVYPADTTIQGFDDAAWTAVPPLPPPAGGESDRKTQVETRIYANWGVKTSNHALMYASADDPITFALQALVNGEWRTYQLVDEINASTAHVLHKLDFLLAPGSADVRRDRLLKDTHHDSRSPAELTALGSENFYRWFGDGLNLLTDNGGGVMESLIKFDPRSRRFGLARTVRGLAGRPLRSSAVLWNYNDQFTSNFVTTRERRPGLGSNGIPTEHGFQFWAPPDKTSYIFAAPAGLISNNPDTLSADHPMRHSDRDGVTRPADGYYGARPTFPGAMDDRPVILNRPFRSVGELGYAFRDLPWKTLDFSSRYSGDLGLLDMFSLEESTKAFPVVAGTVSLNAASKEVLKALLRDSLRQELDESQALTEAEAEAIAEAIVDEREAHGPYLNVSDVIPRVFHLPAGGGPLASLTRKEAREAAVRTLTALTGTRTWNFLIDLVVQAGKLPPSADSMADFVVDAQKRVWLHVAMDRITGEIVDIHRERVHD